MNDQKSAASMLRQVVLAAVAEGGSEAEIAARLEERADSLVAYARPNVPEISVGAGSAAGSREVRAMTPWGDVVRVAIPLALNVSEEMGDDRFPDPHSRDTDGNIVAGYTQYPDVPSIMDDTPDDAE